MAHEEHTHDTAAHACCGPDHAHGGKRFDWLLWSTASVIIASFLAYFFWPGLEQFPALHHFTTAVHEMLLQMWWGVLMGIFFVGLLGRIPRELVMGALGSGSGFKSILRATLAGLLFDVCSHGILLIGMQLYKRGASLGQVMAFLIASPWNSFSLTLILWALIGLKWTLLFIALSAAIALLSGVIFDRLVTRGTLPANPNRNELPADFRFFPALKMHLGNASIRPLGVARMLWDGLKDSKPILRWLLLGIVLAGLLRAFFSPEDFAQYFGPTALGLLLTLLLTTVLEVCSEGSTPIASDILTRAHAPGNAFAFLMAGVATDYTEILSLKETTKSWKIAFFLPLVTVPQVIALALILNG